MTSKLLPCPFCGSEARELEWPEGGDMDRFCCSNFVSDCIACDIEATREQWNTRAAPEAPRQSKVATGQWRIPVNGDWFYGTKAACERERAEYESTFTDLDREEAGVVLPEQIYVDSLSPDHSGGAAGVVLPEPTPYQPKGEWSFERCEDGAIVIKNGKDWTVIKSGDGPIYEQFLYRFCEQQMKELTAPTINENAEFEKWRNTQIDVLTRNGYPEGAEAFRNLGSVQWAGWQARARLDKVKELNQ